MTDISLKSLKHWTDILSQVPQGQMTDTTSFLKITRNNEHIMELFTTFVTPKVTSNKKNSKKRYVETVKQTVRAKERDA